MKKINLFLIVIFTLTFFSCKEIDNNHQIIDDESTESNTEVIDDMPSIESIKSDLLDKSVKIDTYNDIYSGKWNFDKLEEFESVEIVNSKLLDDYNLNLEIRITVLDNSNNNTTAFSGNLTLNYYRSNKDQGYWVFQDVSGSIKRDDSVSESSNSDYDNSNNYQSESETSTSDDNNDNNRLIICPNCNGTGEGYIKCPKDFWLKKGSIQLTNGDYAECPKCNGTGEVLGTCKVCKGEGRVNEYE
ncbi:MAG: DnaJ central domain [Bacteroidota bacterium]|jgi:hypothetical protein